MTDGQLELCDITGVPIEIFLHDEMFPKSQTEGTSIRGRIWRRQVYIFRLAAGNLSTHLAWSGLSMACVLSRFTTDALDEPQFLFDHFETIGVSPLTQKSGSSFQARI